MIREGGGGRGVNSLSDHSSFMPKLSLRLGPWTPVGPFLALAWLSALATWLSLAFEKQTELYPQT